MRPDQHKKKKNSEYKKKHGIASDQGVKHDKNEPTAGPRSEGRRLIAPGEAKAGATRQEIDHADAEDQTGRQESRRFSKRKIESNWDKYEDFGQEFVADRGSPESNVPIGADYQNLLDRATSGSSRFQFKNEKDWENVTNEETNNKAGPSLMSIDCHALALSLSSISLEQRLEIDKKYSIEDDFRQSYTSNSLLDIPLTNHGKNHTNNEKLRQNVASTNTDVGFSQPNTDKGIEENNKENYTPVNKSNSPEEETTQRHHLTNLENDKRKLQQSEQSENDKVVSRTSVGEDDLELLLGFDDTKEVTSTHGDTVSASANKIDETTAHETASDTKENLEDWLDSILD